MWSLCNFSWNLQRKQKECNVSHMECDNVCFPCQLNVGNNNIKDKVEKCVKAIKDRQNVKDWQNVTENCEYLQHLSQSAIIPAHFNLSFEDNSSGIHTATPLGVVCVLYENGLLKYLLRNLYDCAQLPERFLSYWERITTDTLSYDDLIKEYPKNLSKSEKKQKIDSTEYERRICILVSSAKQQSDCPMIKCSTFYNGVTQLSRLTGQEYPGLILITIISINDLMSTSSKEK